MSGLQYRYGVSGVRSHQARISFDDLGAQVLSLSKLPAPQLCTRCDARSITIEFRGPLSSSVTANPAAEGSPYYVRTGIAGAPHWQARGDAAPTSVRFICSWKEIEATNLQPAKPAQP